MVEVSPFNALRFAASAGAPSDVVAPPYDVISDPLRAALESRSPHNVVRLILPHPDGADERYANARALLDAWRADGILVPDPAPSLTIYEQTYSVGGVRKTQRGILAAVRLDAPGEGGVLPHERTYADIVDDRLRLLRATETNLDCIFCVYAGEDDAAAAAIDATVAGAPLQRFVTEEDGTEHAIWRVSDPDTIATITAPFEKSKVVIADGHHRWRTALHYRDERRAADGAGAWDSQLMLLVDASRFGPSLLPIHRVLKDIDPDAFLRALAPSFTISDAPREDPEALAAGLAARPGRCFAAFDRSRAWWLTLADEDAAARTLPADRSDAWKDLDVAILHSFVFDHLLGGVTPRFVHSATEVAEAIDTGDATLGILLAPMPFEAVLAVAEAGDAMPQKSTYFIPKPKTGVVLRALDS